MTDKLAWLYVLAWLASCAFGTWMQNLWAGVFVAATLTFLALAMRFNATLTVKFEGLPPGTIRPTEPEGKDVTWV